MEFQQAGNLEYIFSDKDYLWRYVDLPKLLHFVTTASINLARIDSFEDPLEGWTYDALDHEFFKPYKDSYLGLEHLQLERIIQARNSVDSVLRSRVNHFASCWFLSEHVNEESIYHWERYGCSGVAIQIKALALIELLNKWSNEQSNHEYLEILSYGKVHYLQLNKKLFANSKVKDFEWPGGLIAFKKDKTYQHENEFRIVGGLKRELWNYQFNVEKAPGITNLSIKLAKDISELEFSIVLNPYMENWQKNSIIDTLDRFELKHKIKESVLPSKNVLEEFAKSIFRADQEYKSRQK
jgi:hypothetical protein